LQHFFRVPPTREISRNLADFTADLTCTGNRSEEEAIK